MILGNIIRKFMKTLFALAIFLCGTTFVQSADISWNNPAGGSFGTTTNWNPQQIPGTADDAIFNLNSSGGYNITLGQDYTNDQLIVRTDKTTLDIGGHTYTLQNTSYTTPSVFVGQNVGDNANLTLRNGNISSLYGYIGSVVGGGLQGAVVVDGAQWSNTYGIYVGRDSTGSGTLTIQNGGQVSDENCQVTGGIVTVTGAGSTLTNSGRPTEGFMTVGRYANGTLNIQNGGTVSSRIGQLGSSSGGGSGTGTVNVIGTGSSWTNSTTLDIGSGNYGELNIQNGGTVSTTQAFFGSYGSGSGVATIGGTGSSMLNVTDSLYLGGNDSGQIGNGTLNVNAGGTANVTNTLKLWGSGTVNLNGGTIHTRSFTANSGSTFNFNNGTLRVDGGTFTPNSSDFRIGGATADDLPVLEVVGGASTNGIYSLTVGAVKNGILTVNGGSVNVSDLYVCNSVTSHGTVNVTGANSIITASTRVYVGGDGTGSLNISNGGTVRVQGSEASSIGLGTGTGTVLITGVGSLWDSSGPLYIGGDYWGTLGYSGTLTLQNSGKVKTTSNLRVYNTGTINLDGGIIEAGSLTVDEIGDFHWTTGTLKLTNSHLFVDSGASPFGGLLTIDNGKVLQVPDFNVEVGRDSTGTLDITSGGSVYSYHGRIGRLAGNSGTVNVSGTGATWSTSHLFIVADCGTGALNISAGGSISAATGIIGYSPGSNGTLTIGGTSSTASVSGSMYVGGYDSAAGGTGTVTVNTGGTLNVTNTLKIWAPGTVNLNGGTINVNSIDRAGTFSWNSGTLRFTTDPLYIKPDQTAFGSSLTVGTGKRLEVHNTLFVGEDGNGSLAVTGGGKVVAESECYLGKGTTGHWGSVAVQDTGSNVSVMRDLFVGYSDEGALNISNQGVVSSEMNTYVGPFGTGYVNVSSGGSLCSTGDLNLGYYLVDSESGSYYTYASGNGSLTINQNSTVIAGGALRLYSGIVNLNGGIIKASSIIRESWQVYPRSVDFHFNSGTINYTDDLVVNIGDYLQTILDGSLSIRANRQIAVNGSTTLNDTLYVDGGTLSTGSLINAHYLRFNSGTFNLTSANFSVGASGIFGSQLAIPSTKTINVTNATTIDAGSQLLLQNGRFSSGTLTNNGEIRLEGAASTLTAGTLTNNGLVVGSGEIYAPLTNNTAGRVSVATAERLTFHGTNNTNNGELELVGGVMKFTGALANPTNGVIVGNGTLETGGLTNDGQIAFSATSNVRGPVANNQYGLIISSGGTTTFYDDVVSNGEIHTSLNSFTVFFGSVSGRAAFTGPGTVLFEGDIHPGNSPAKVNFQGHLQMGDESKLYAEIGGSVVDTGYDRLAVTKTAFVAGKLDVRLINGFTPTALQTFDILTAGQALDGEFSNVTNGHIMLPDGISAFAVNVDTLAKRVRLSNYGFNEWKGAENNQWTNMDAWTAMEPNGPAFIARFGKACSAAGIVTLDTARTVKAIQFDNANSYMISGDQPLTLDNGNAVASIDITDGSHTLSSSLILSSDLKVDVAGSTDTLTISQELVGNGHTLLKSGNGTLDVSGMITNLGNTTVSEGALTVDALNNPLAVVSVMDNARLTAKTLRCHKLVIGTPGVFAVPEPGVLPMLIAGGLCIIGITAFKRKARERKAVG